jgi:hypothetical protein
VFKHKAAHNKVEACRLERQRLVQIMPGKANHFCPGFASGLRQHSL